MHPNDFSSPTAVKHNIDALFTTTHFTKLTIKGIDFGALIDFYFDWVEGSGKYSNKRKGRTKLGNPFPIDRAALMRGGTIEGTQNCEISCRTEHNRIFLLRWIHQDQKNPKISWHSVIRIIVLPEAVQTLSVEHASGRYIPNSERASYAPGAPSVLTDICELPGVSIIQPKHLKIGPCKIEQDEANHFVKNILFEPTRTLPYVLISTPKGEESPKIDPEKLAKLLATQAVIAVLTKDASRNFSRAFEELGKDERLGKCFDGAVRIYHPGLGETDDPRKHFLWHPVKLSEYGPKQDATQRLAGEITSKMSWRNLPSRFFSLIGDFDSEKEGVKTKFLLKPTTDVSPTAKEELTEKEIQISALRKQLQTLSESNEQLRNENIQLELAKKEFEALLELSEQEKDELSQEKDDARKGQESAENHAKSLLKKIKALEKDQNFELTKEKLEILRSACKREVKSLSDALLLLEILFPDRIEILDSAWSSAKKSEAFNAPQKAWELMFKLGNEYWAAVQEGGDAKAKNVFTDKDFSARDSKGVETNTKAKKLRTFEVNGKEIVMWKHLKIGNKDSAFETFRLYFELEEKKIYIGHCGKHLDHK